jgi:hypothetical protein
LHAASGPLFLWHADLDAACRHLGIFPFAVEIKLGRADIAVPGEFPHLVHLSAIADSVVDDIPMKT